MTFISGTRLRVRSIFYLPQFFWANELSARQLAYSPSFLGGRLLVDRDRTFWTVTAWEGEAAMRAYRNSGAHRKVMPKLLKWCNEATVVHWNQESSVLPNWQEIHRRMVSEGKVSKVNNPTSRHTTKQFPEPRVGRLSRELRPRQKGKAKVA